MTENLPILDVLPLTLAKGQQPMHGSIGQYLLALEQKRRSPLTLKAVRQDLTHFVTWWEARRARSFSPAFLLHRDVLDWRAERQRQDGAAPATINRALASLRGYCTWATKCGLMPENVAVDVPAITTSALSPRGLPSEAVDALLRAARLESNQVVRLRNEAMLALLVYGGLRVQEVCDVQLRDLDLRAGTLTVRSGKAGRARRIPLHTDAQHSLQRYLDQVRCPAGLPGIGTVQECVPLLIGIDVTRADKPIRLSIGQRVIQRVIKQLGQQAAVRLRAEAEAEPAIVRVEQLQKLAQLLERATPHQLRHSLAQRMLRGGAQLSEVQHMLGHSRLSTTGIYLTPSEDELREAIQRAGL
jgi:site-specific recombinase XerD